MRASGPRTQALHDAGQRPAHSGPARCGPEARALRRCAMRARGPRTQALHDAGQRPAHPGDCVAGDDHRSCFFATIVIQLMQIHYPLVVLS
jgi:hypothetical protein